MKKSRRQRKKYILTLFIAFFILIILVFIGFKVTENGVYTIYDTSTNEEYGTYKHFFFAKWKMNSFEDNDNIAIKDENQKVRALKHAVVNFNTKDITQNTTYTVDNSNEQGYINGNYGADGLYLDTSNDGSKVLFMISGIKAWVSIEEVELYYYDTYPQSYYYISDGSLIHAIMLNGETNQYQVLAIGKAPEFMKEDTIYFSYDGNWFYTDMDMLNNDIINNVTDNAVNKEAYYNFYQYVPHRTTTTVRENEYNEYLENAGINSVASAYPCADNESVLYNLQDTFIKVQEETYINSTMMFALALNESGYGKSQYAIEYNNLFGHAAYDSNPDNANVYDSLEDCIYQHAYNFLQLGYANPNDERYYGSWFGNKSSGINVMYASDPYWGEKAASFYYSLDDDKDINNIQLITTKLNKDINVYADDNAEDILYSYSSGDIVSFIIQKTENGWYQITSEAPVNNNKIDINKTFTSESIGYVRIEDLQ